MASTVRDNIMVHDTLEAVLVTDGGELKYFGATSEASISQSIDQEELRASIGNSIQAVINRDKTVNFSITTLFHNDNLIALQAGKAFASKTQNKPVYGTIKSDGSGTIDLTSLLAKPATAQEVIHDFKAIDQFGNDVAGQTYDFTGWTISGLANDTEYMIVGVVEEAAVQTLEFDADTFPKNQQVYLHGIAYNPKTNVVVADIYYYFPVATPDGAIDRNYAAGQNISDAVSFKTVADANGVYGTYFVVDRA